MENWKEEDIYQFLETDESVLYEYEYENMEDYDGEKYRSTKKREPSILIDSDYNLNSPIMPDVLNNLYDLINFKVSPKHHKKRTLAEYNKLKGCINNELKIKDISHTYKVLRNIITNSAKSNFYHKFVDTWSTEIGTVKIIPDTFLSTLHSNTKNFSIKEIVLKDADLGALLDRFLEISLIIEVMSDRRRLEVKNFPDTYKFDVLDEDLVQMRTFSFVGYFSNKILLDSKNYVLFDYNMLLMIKDILIGRFNTLLIIKLNLEDRYSPNCEKLFKEIMRIGDDYLLKEGNRGFDSITMLEPICVEQMDKLANKTRPMIIKPTHYSEYIDSKTKSDFKADNIFIQKMRDTIYSMENIYDLTTIYGSFRLWGHPYIEYEIGLKKLKEQVRLPKPNIDPNYCDLLASDLMRDILISVYKKTKNWHVLDTDNNRKIPGIKSLLENSWLTPSDRKKLEGHWHKLDIDPVIEVPEDISDSSLFADKTHSKNLKEVKSIATRDNANPIPTERLLRTYLKEERINIKDFILDIDTSGFAENDLIIGLKAKERELKRFGRFFTLMTWKLRMYFVISEYMIKKDIVPRYKGLTMADGFIEVMEKMLDRTKGQRGEDYVHITYANHIDYTKWNNHQRDEAVGPVFSVLDKLYGLNNFFRLSHKIFQNCTVYYPERPEFFGKDSQFYWKGQDGGFEGIRQKGWSLVGVLCLLRESKRRSTKVDLLAQGDNQVIFCQYSLPPLLEEEDLKSELQSIYKNNETIMSFIQVAAEKIGLVINQDETVQSANFSIYGKIPIYKGNILNLETKASNRVSGVTNDQLPTSANIMSSVNSMALSVCQRDSLVRCATYYQLIFGVFVLNVIKMWNAIALQGMSLKPLSINPLIRWLYHDKCLGGNTGMALTRFLIRRFPDPVSEALVFYKKMHDLIRDDHVRDAMIMMGTPKYRPLNKRSYNKLAEDPTSLNIYKSGDIAVLVKSQVKAALEKYTPNIKNKMLKNALLSSKKQEDYILEFLSRVRPCFPRFISDFKQASVCGYIDGIIGMVENSATIRTMFSADFGERVLKLSVAWEREQMSKSIIIVNHKGTMWDCSSSQCDHLRLNSWNTKVVGSTIPHPYEYQDKYITNIGLALDEKKDILTCLVSPKFDLNINKHGPNRPYLGSNTKESSGAYQTWEKELTNPLFNHAAQLRKNINWTVERGSKLAQSIINNLNYVTGLNLNDTEETASKKRTGTAQHRYKSNRQASGGFCNISPNVLSWFTVTSDNMTDLSTENYDFMFQASLIYAETVGAHVVKDKELRSFGLAISCQKCIRPLENLSLSCDFVYSPKSIAKKFWLSQIIKSEIITRDELYLNLFPTISGVPEDGSFAIGMHQGLAGLLSCYGMSDDFHLSDIFSMGVMMKLNAKQWIKGLKVGVSLVTGYVLLQHPEFVHGSQSFSIYKNRFRNFCKLLIKEPDVSSRLRLNNLDLYVSYKSSSLSVNYPPNNDELSDKLLNLMFDEFDLKQNDLSNIKQLLFKNPIIYQDYDHDLFKKVIVIGSEVISRLVDDKLNHSRSKIYEQLKRCCRDEEDIRNLNGIQESMFVSEKELKTHAEEMIRFEQNYQKGVYSDVNNYSEIKVMRLCAQSAVNSVKIKHKAAHLNQALKPFRFATSAHYKLNEILNQIGIIPAFAFIGGDGSGGMTALVLRKYPNSETIYNSLLEVGSETLKGGNPGIPSAINALPYDYKSRCLNKDKCWTEQTDLSAELTWKDLRSWVVKKKFDLFVVDAHARTLDEFVSIYRNLVRYERELVSESGIIIIKCYTGLLKEVYNVLNDISYKFMYCVQTSFTRDYSTEVYILISDKEIDFKSKSIIYTSGNFNLTLSDYKSEFNRSLLLKKMNLHSLIPKDLKENYLCNLSNLLSNLNLNLSLCELVISLLINDEPYKGFRIIAQKCLFDNLSPNDFPSDQALIKCWAVLSGIMGFLSIKLESLKHYENYMMMHESSHIAYISVEEKYIYFTKHFKSHLRYPKKKIYPKLNESLGAVVTRCLYGLYREDYKTPMSYNCNITFDFNVSDFF